MIAATRVPLAFLVLSILNVTPAHSETQPTELTVMWGQTVSSQLRSEDPVAVWNVQMRLPVVQRMGLGVQLRFDSVVFGERGNFLSQAVHPGRTDYNLAVWLQPPGSRMGFEVHHVSSHEVEPLHRGSAASFEESVDVGGASNFVSLLYRHRGVEARAGVGAVWSDTNTVPILLGVEGVLLNSRIAAGPLATLSVPLSVGPLYGRAGVVYIYDKSHQGRVEGSTLAWASSLHWRFSTRASFGVSASGNNGVPGYKRADNIVSAFVKLHWNQR